MSAGSNIVHVLVDFPHETPFPESEDVVEFFRSKVEWLDGYPW